MYFCRFFHLFCGYLWTFFVFQSIVSIFENSASVFQSEHETVYGILNQTIILPCRLRDKDIEETKNIGIVWKRARDEMYLLHGSERLASDKRFHLMTSDFHNPSMDMALTNVQISDQGLYQCLLANGIKSKAFTKNVTLIVQVPSQIFSRGSSDNMVRVREGETLKLTCNVTGIPRPTVRWYFLPSTGTKMELYSDRKNFDLVVNYDRLLIRNISRSNHGVYTCVADNGISTKASRHIEVNILFSPVVHMLNARIGQMLHLATMLKATIIGNPIQDFFWEFKNKRITKTMSHCMVRILSEKYCISGDSRLLPSAEEITTTLWIFNLTASDFGSYHCVVVSDEQFGVTRGTTVVTRTIPAESPLDAMYPNVLPRENYEINNNPSGQTTNRDQQTGFNSYIDPLQKSTSKEELEEFGRNQPRSNSYRKPDNSSMRIHHFSSVFIHMIFFTVLIILLP